MADRIQDLGVFTAYGEAREAGYEGTKAEFEEGLKKAAEAYDEAEAAAAAAAQSAVAAAASAVDASTAAAEADSSADAAQASEAAADVSAGAAASSAIDAGESADAASAAQTGAETAQVAAELAQTAAEAAATAADGSKMAAAGSASAAASSATAAAGSATSASGSATAAAGSATAAAGSATDAAASAAAAADSATDAAASATQAASNAQAALGDIAPVFEDTKPYNVGDYVIYTDGKLYRFTDAHAAGAWVGTDATTVVVGDEISELKSTFTARVDFLEINKADVIVSSAFGSIASFPDGADDMPVKELNVAIEPVQAGSGDPSPDNVRPISGWTGAKVTRTGKNLIDNAYADTSGSNFLWIYRNVGLLLKANQTYTFSVNQTVDSIKIISVDESVIYASVSSAASSLSYSPTADVLVVFRVWKNDGGTLSGLNPQLEVGSTVTDYEPDQGETYDITFPTEAGTVYGGTLDATNGTLTVDRAMVDMGALSWTYEVENVRFFSDSINISVKKSTTNIISSMYVVGSTLTTNGTMAITGGGNLYVRNTAYNSVADFKSAMSGVQLCYELATPITYTLTASEIRTLLGANNIWADTGDVSVAYKADTKLYIDKKFTELQALILEN